MQEAKFQARAGPVWRHGANAADRFVVKVDLPQPPLEFAIKMESMGSRYSDVSAEPRGWGFMKANWEKAFNSDKRSEWYNSLADRDVQCAKLTLGAEPVRR